MLDNVFFDLEVREKQVVSEYRHCGLVWVDVWDCACDSECPECGADIQVYRIIHESE
jgi:hypothetical protein